MRGRHIPRLCRMCDAPMARQGGACWHCGAVWGDRSERRNAEPKPDVASPAAKDPRPAGTELAAV
jgi:hypothetical protein